MQRADALQNEGCVERRACRCARVKWQRRGQGSVEYAEKAPSETYQRPNTCGKTSRDGLWGENEAGSSSYRSHSPEISIWEGDGQCRVQGDAAGNRKRGRKGEVGEDAR